MIRRNGTVFDALRLFDRFQERGKSLDAIVITASGMARERPGNHHDIRLSRTDQRARPSAARHRLARRPARGGVFRREEPKLSVAFFVGGLRWRSKTTTVRFLTGQPASYYKSIETLWNGIPIDFGRITVLFGPNGSGKTNLLEAVAWTFQNVLSEEPRSSPQPRLHGAAPEEAMSAFISLELDRWHEEGSIDQRIAWELLADEDFVWRLGLRAVFAPIWDYDVQHSQIHAPLEQLLSELPPGPSTRGLERLIDFWANALARAGGPRPSRRSHPPISGTPSAVLLRLRRTAESLAEQKLDRGHASANVGDRRLNPGPLATVRALHGEPDLTDS